jgi:hypothetical protein
MPIAAVAKRANVFLTNASRLCGFFAGSAGGGS